jgi:hypothetical protein
VGIDVLFPQAVGLFVVAVETVERPLQLDGQLRLRADRLRLAALARKVLADT